MATTERYGDLAMNSNKLTGLGQGTSNGDSVRFEEAGAAIQTADGDKQLIAFRVQLNKASSSDPTLLASWGVNGDSTVSVDSIQTAAVRLVTTSSVTLRTALQGALVSTATNFVSVNIATTGAADEVDVSFVDASGSTVNISGLSTANAVDVRLVGVERN
jgi:hypothetical protein